MYRSHLGGVPSLLHGIAAEELEKLPLVGQDVTAQLGWGQILHIYDILCIYIYLYLSIYLSIYIYMGSRSHGGTPK
jgi:hypothetical protein